MQVSSRRKKMVYLSLDSKQQNQPQPSKTHYTRTTKPTTTNTIHTEIEGLIRVYNNGQVERFPIIPHVPCTSTPPHFNVISRDIVIDSHTNLWARIYIPYNNNDTSSSSSLPLIIYFHGGGFCVGSAAWSCYHDFLIKLASSTNVVILSVNYRLAPEYRLPTAYDDGVKSVTWVKHQGSGLINEHRWWTSKCDFTKLFLAGDSAGANIAHNVVTRLGTTSAAVRGLILIQPFFGGEMRTMSERNPQPASTALSLQVSDEYWKLALPVGSSRDHPWCNPIKGVMRGGGVVSSRMLVFVSEMDILRDRNVEFCNVMVNAGKSVKMVMCRGVGHAFQILDKSSVGNVRVKEMIGHVKGFISCN